MLNKVHPKHIITVYELDFNRRYLSRYLPIMFHLIIAKRLNDLFTNTHSTHPYYNM